MEDNEFIQLLIAGNEDAFRKLVQNNSRVVYSTALNIVQNIQDAEDISQEVFIEVINSITKFKGESKFSTWLYRITINKSLELVRSRSRKKRFALFNIIGENKNASKDVPHFNHPGVQLENKELASILFSAIDKLTENQKTAFVLHKLEHLSYVEIAEVMQLSVSSIESLLFRAKQNLQKLLGEYYENNLK